MNKTGLVMKIEKNSVFIMTSSGEFFKVRTLSKSPKIGEEYTGILKKENGLIKILITAACLLFMALSGGGVYTYYTPTSSIIINMNPSIELQANRWIRIIKCSALNKDGETVLKAISIKNKPLNQGLNLIIEQSKKDDFINEKYIEDGKVISIQLSTKNNKSLDLSKFEEYAAKSKLSLKINSNGREIYLNRVISKETLKVKIIDTPNIKRIKNPIIKKVEPKDTEVKNIQNNYGNANEHSPIVKDNKVKENYHQRNYDNKGNEKKSR